jgi:hypothetical protein
MCTHRGPSGKERASRIELLRRPLGTSCKRPAPRASDARLAPASAKGSSAARAIEFHASEQPRSRPTCRRPGYRYRLQGGGGLTSRTASPSASQRKRRLCRQGQPAARVHQASPTSVQLPRPSLGPGGCGGCTARRSALAQRRSRGGMTCASQCALARSARRPARPSRRPPTPSWRA